MATRTENLKLSKAETSDAIKSTLTANNQNFDKLDGVITRLKNNQLQGTASGTEIEISDAGEVESVLQVSGNSEQDSRSGKNLLSTLKLTEETTVNGVTFTPIFDDNNNLLYVNVNGTATAQTTQLISSFVPTLNVEYKINGCSANGDTSTAYVYLTGGTTIITDADKSVTWTTEGTKGYHIIVASGATITNMKFYPMIRLATVTDNSYEPYGLQPSPDYPSEIRSVKSRSDNLFDISKKKDNTSFKWTDGADYTPSEGTIISDYIPIGSIKSLASNYYFNIAFYNSSKSYLGNGENVTTESNPSTTKIVIPNNSNIAYFRVNYRKNSSNGNVDMTTVTDIMLNKGTEALPYQPYGNVPVEVKVEGKNLALWEVGTFDQNTGADLTSTTRARAKFNIVAGKEYVINIPYARFRNLAILDNADTFIGNYQDCTINRANDYFSFIPKFSGIAKIVISNTDSNTNIDINQYNGVVQIERGSVPTPYVPYVEPKIVSFPLGDIELRSTPDGTRDTFERVDGVWNYKNNIGQIIVDSSKSESLGENTYYDSDNYKTFTIAYVRMQWKKAGCQGYSDKFKIITSSNYLALDQAHLFFGNISYTQIWVHLPKSEVPTLDDFKTWLPNNPIELVAPLATPTYIPVEDQALINALDELEELILHKGYNYITATGVNNVKAYLDLSYYKDINIVLDNINANILSLGGGINV